MAVSYLEISDLTVAIQGILVGCLLGLASNFELASSFGRNSLPLTTILLSIPKNRCNFCIIEICNTKTLNMDTGDIEVRTEAQRVCVQPLTLEDVYSSFRMQCRNSHRDTYCATCFASLACI